MRILAFAYACEPGEGSEPGAGWAWARMLAQLGETWVVTRSNNMAAIEAALPHTPEAALLHFVPVDLSERARRWKRGRRGIHLYYLLWQMAAVRRARALALRFDLVWHLTMANAWFGSVAWRIDAPFVYGPVGGGVRVPIRHLPSLGLRGVIFEAVRASARGAGRFVNPLARWSWARADLILTQNPETRRWLPRRHRSKALVMPNVVIEPSEMSGRWASPTTPTVLFAARLLPWKGTALALRALVHLPGWRLLVCGEGPDERRLHRLTAALGLTGRVRFLGRVPRPDLLRTMREDATIFLFPSLREEAGWVVAEAIASGLPVVCLDRGGPPLLGGTGVRVEGVARTAVALARRVREVDPSAPVAQSPSPDERLEQIRRVLRDRGLPSVGAGPSGEVGVA